VCGGLATKKREKRVCKTCRRFYADKDDKTIGACIFMDLAYEKPIHLDDEEAKNSSCDLWVSRAKEV
jgi:hypothetical protein